MTYFKEGLRLLSSLIIREANGYGMGGAEGRRGRGAEGFIASLQALGAARSQKKKKKQFTRRQE